MRAISLVLVLIFCLQGSALATGQPLSSPARNSTVVRPSFPMFRNVHTYRSPAVTESVGKFPTPVIPGQVRFGPRPLFSTGPHIAPVPSKQMPRLKRALLTQSVNNTSPGTTGEAPWWRYYRGTVPGFVSYDVNVANRNLLLTSTDMNIPNKGVPLVFTRVYNSQSTSDYANSDGSGASDAGDGWTNSFGAHISANSSGGWSIFDDTGARWDYSSTLASLTPGQHATLAVDGDPTYYDWTQPNGTVFVFYAPTRSDSLAGRLSVIAGRNHNTYISFGYAFTNNDASNWHNLTTITAQTQSGQTATLAFGDVTYNSTTHRELASLTFPNGTTKVTYSYAYGTSLNEVIHPQNSAGSRAEVYTYTATTGHQINGIDSPRYVSSSDHSDGAFFTFGYTSGTNSLSGMTVHAAVNLTPADGTVTSLYGSSIPAGIVLVNTISFVPGTSNTTISDSYHHKSVYVYDTRGRVVEADHYPTSAATYLKSTSVWDSNNNLVSVVEPRGYESGATASAYETDMVYDTNGNVAELALPSTSTSAGQIRPTWLISHDSYNNVLAVCDPVYDNQHGKNWGTSTPAPGATPCPSNDAGTTRYTWATPAPQPTGAPSPEPFGELTSITQPATSSSGPNGYQTQIAYAATAQGGNVDYGLPTSITPAAFTEGGATFAANISLVYDAFGNVVCSNRYTDSTGNKHWSIAGYDSLNRVSWVADPDDTVKTNTACPKTNGGISNAALYTSYGYYDDGSISSYQTPAERAAGVSSSITYDRDGNVTSVTKHFATTTAGTTSYYYDALDRLVETQMPADSTTDAWPTIGWYERYLYDVSAGGQSCFYNICYNAQGNYFKRMRYVTVSNIQYYLDAGTGHSWYDTDGTGYDYLDRPTQRFMAQPGTQCDGYPTNCHELTWTSTYDAAGSAGLLSSIANPLGDTTTFTYDASGKVIGRNYTLGTGSSSIQNPNETYSYDPDGRVVQLGTVGLGSESYTYDATGLLASTAENYNFANWSGNTTLTYDRYPNGQEQDISISSTPLSQSAFRTRVYRNDGRLRSETYAINGSSYVKSVLYTAGGRPTQLQSPYSGANNIAYDPQGRLSSYELPEGTMNGFTFDPEGAPTAYTFTAANGNQYGGPVTVKVQYNVRGELINFGNLNGFLDAFGFMYPPDQQNAQVTWGNNGQYSSTGTLSTAFDSRYAAPMGQVFTPNSGQPTPGPNSTPVPITYDKAGRVIGHAYDINDRPSDTLQWGAPSHPLLFTQRTANYGCGVGAYTFWYTSMHWADAQMLFSSMNGGCNGTGPSAGPYANQWWEVKLGAMGDTTYPDTHSNIGIHLSDRDFSGVAVADRNLTGNTGVFLQPPGRACAGYKDAAGGGTASGYSSSLIQDSGCQTWYGMLGQPRHDGYYSNLTGFINGIRNLDPSTGSWTSPDASGGEIGNPLSQLPYAYANNNAVFQDDPTGQYSQNTGSSCAFGYHTHTDAGQCVDNNWWDPAIFNTLRGDYLGKEHREKNASCSGRPPRDIPPPQDGKGFTPEFAFASEHGLDPVALFNSTYNKESPFNYHQYDPGQHQYRATANFGLGVYSAGSGIGTAAIILAIQIIGSLPGHNLTDVEIADDQTWVLRGFEWAMDHCAPVASGS